MDIPNKRYQLILNINMLRNTIWFQYKTRFSNFSIRRNDSMHVSHDFSLHLKVKIVILIARRLWNLQRMSAPYVSNTYKCDNLSAVPVTLDIAVCVCYNMQCMLHSEIDCSSIKWIPSVYEMCN